MTVRPGALHNRSLRTEYSFSLTLPVPGLQTGSGVVWVTLESSAGFGAGSLTFGDSLRLLFDHPQALALLRVIEYLDSRPKGFRVEVGIAVCRLARFVPQEPGEVSAALALHRHP